MTGPLQGSGGGRGADPSTGEVKVLYVVGSKRSGSTILGNVLGELDGFFHAGELRTLWGKGLREGRRCGCGVPVGDCPFWSSVLEEVFAGGGERPSDPGAVLGWQRQSIRSRHLPRMLRAVPGRATGWPPLDGYARVVARLYRAVARASGSTVVVDSSKQLADAALVRLLPGVAAFYVHLVRDPRAVAYSWGRKKASPGEGSRQEMLRLGPATSTRDWSFANLASEALRLRHGRGRSLLVRYEDFVKSPSRTLKAIAGLVGERPGSIPLVGQGVVELGVNHTAGGNPDRLRSGTIELHADDEWRRAQRRRDRLLATALAAPLLPRYRYPLFVQAPDPGAARDVSTTCAPHGGARWP